MGQALQSQDAGSLQVIDHRCYNHGRAPRWEAKGTSTKSQGKQADKFRRGTDDVAEVPGNAGGCGHAEG